MSNLHPSYSRWWRLVHLWGLVCPLIGGWTWYFASVAVLEAVALLRRKFGDTWSEHVWDFLYDERGRMSTVRVFLVAAWSAYFCGAFAVNGWFSPGANAAIAILFEGWLWIHFFQDRRRRKKGVRWA